MNKPTSFLKRAFTGAGPTWFYVSLIGLMYIVLASGRFSTLIPEGGHDDGLQLHLSQSLSSGHWLGTYNNLTLAKGIAYPAWTALLHTLDIPLWFGNAILFIVAALAIVYATRRLIPKRWLKILLFAFLLFNPLVSARAYRDSIASAIILFVLAWVIGLFLITTKMKHDTAAKQETDVRELWGYAGIGGISLPFWWYLREDYFWVLPFVIVLLLVTLGIIIHRRRKRFVSKHQTRVVIIVALLPFITTLLLGASIATVNKYLYGRFVVNDYTSHDFEEAYGALTRIKDENWQITVPVSRSMREKAYAASPAFRELQPCLDDNGLGACEGFIMNIRAKGDYEGGWFFWALRQAVQEQGYYKDAAMAEAYYVRLANEINTACDTGVLDCVRGERASLTAPFTVQTIGPAIQKLPVAISYVVFLNGAENSGSLDASAYRVDKQTMADYLGVRYSTEQLNIGVRVKDAISHCIAWFYKYINPVLLVMALIVLGWGSLRLKTYAPYWRELLIGWGLLLLLGVRVFMITYVDVTAFPAIDALYFSSLYPVMFLFEGMMIGSAVSLVKDKTRRHRIVSKS